MLSESQPTGALPVKTSIRVIFCASLLILVANIPAQAVDKAKVERQFHSWLKQSFWPLAKAKGVSRKNFQYQPEQCHAKLEVA